jgi:hypothetical protein
MRSSPALESREAPQLSQQEKQQKKTSVSFIYFRINKQSILFPFYFYYHANFHSLDAKFQNELQQDTKIQNELEQDTKIQNELEQDTKIQNELEQDAKFQNELEQDAKFQKGPQTRSQAPTGARTRSPTFTHFPTLNSSGLFL